MGNGGSRASDITPEHEARKLVVKNIPATWNTETLSNYLEAKLDEDVTDIKQEDGAPGVALVTFRKPVDIRVGALEMDSVAMPRGVVLWNLLPSASKDAINKTLQKCSTREITLQPQLGVCVVQFSKEKDVNYAMNCLQRFSKRIEPYYDTFHKEVFAQLLSSGSHARENHRPRPSADEPEERQNAGNLVFIDSTESDEENSNEENSSLCSQDTQSPEPSNASSDVVCGGKEKSETLNVGVAKLALLEKSKYFDALKQCRATRDKKTGIVTLTCSPGGIVTAKLGLKFKVGGIKTESFAVSPETAAALKSTSHQPWATFDSVHVDISASGSITCVAFSEDDKQRTVEAVKSCISQLEGGKNPKTCQGEPPVVSQVERHFAASAQPDVQHDSRSQLWSSEISSWSLEEGTLNDKENQPRHAGNGGRNPQLTSRSPSGGRSQFPAPVAGNEAARMTGTAQFRMKGIQARCFLSSCKEAFKNVEDRFRADGGVWDMTQGADENELTVKLSGPQDKVTDAHRQLCSLAKRLWHEKISIEKNVAQSKPTELALLARGLRGLENILDLCGGLERTNDCYLEFLLPPPSADSRFSNPAGIPTESASSAKHGTQMTRVASTDIVVKQGDIAKETADILVCVVGTSRKLEDSAVGQAFLKTGGAEFKQNFERSARDSEAGHIVISGGGGGLQCDYVITLVLRRYSSSSDKFLASCLKKVLQMAASFGATSVAMPAIGTGVRLAFPISLVASTSLQEAACLAQSHSPLRSITYVVYDDGDCLEFQQELSLLKGATLSRMCPLPQEISAASVGGEVTTWSQAHVRVYAATKDKCQAAVKAVTDRLRQDFLKKEFIQRRLVGTLRPNVRKEIIEAAGKEGVYVRPPEDRKTEQEIPKLTLQGEAKAVLRAQNAIQQLLEREKTAMGAQSSPLGPRPSRGTIEFLKFMASQVDPEVPSYWKCYQKGKTLKDVVLKALKVDYQLHDIDGKEYQEVVDVIMGTWKKDLVGHGNDAKGLTHKGIRIKTIQRLENLKLYRAYIARRCEMFLQASKKGGPFRKVEHLPNSEGPVLTTKYTKSLLSGEVHEEVNECYLFHGTNAGVVKAIYSRGMQTRLGSAKGMFGGGTYTAESSTKADQYADSVGQRTGGEKMMIMTRVLLGQPYLISQPRDFRLPPCTRSGCNREDCGHPNHFDSVMGHMTWHFREFVLYSENQMYPEYVITYIRI